jgi:HTH-type transcriptional regulator, osmoprotectant uptake regulator
MSVDVSFFTHRTIRTIIGIKYFLQIFFQNSMANSSPSAEDIKREMMQVFGEAYRNFGLNKQMGHIVALLLYSQEALSLDEITHELGMSKGPISQITRRLYERNIIRKVWNPGTRKDYYERHPEMFVNAFRNFAALMSSNTAIATNLEKLVENSQDETLPQDLKRRVGEMEQFYVLMEKHFANFLVEWEETKANNK